MKPDALILPDGELSTDWFPEVDLEEYLDKRIREAEQDPRLTQLDPGPQARAMKAFVYEKAYRHVYRRKAEDPSSWSGDGQGSMAQSDRQVQRWKELADEKERELESVLEQDTGTDQTPPSTSVPYTTGYV